MIATIEIRNFKSIERLKLSLGRLNVLIGENGAGKSNILEAIALAGAASAGKLDNEFLSSRGIRVTQPAHMRSALSSNNNSGAIEIIVSDGQIKPGCVYELTNDNAPYSQWKCRINNSELSVNFSEFMNAITSFAHSEVGGSPEAKEALTSFGKSLASALEKIKDKPIEELKPKEGEFSFPVSVQLQKDNPFVEYMARQAPQINKVSKTLSQFIIYSPENTALRVFDREGQIQPLGINGEGLLKLLSVLTETREIETLSEIKEGLKLLGWFLDFDITEDKSQLHGQMAILDRYLSGGERIFDQRSTNEGFLFLVFYFTLFSSELTPNFFAVDNIDASLNPKLCERLIRKLVEMSKKRDKQAILTTHNPAVLDGLNLDDEDQRLFVVSRGSKGQTRVSRILKPPSTKGTVPIRLSEAFLRGSLGGLPKRF